MDSGLASFLILAPRQRIIAMPGPSLALVGLLLLSMSGVIGYAVVGALYAADLFNSQGAVYFYARDRGGDNAWGEANKATASDTEDGDILGYCVEIDEDYAVAGAPGEDGPGEDRGAVYVFKKTRG
jgi:hypothetical protein